MAGIQTRVKTSFKSTDKLDQVQRQMWTPTDLSDKEKTIQEIQDLEPIVEHTEDNETWTLLRQGISSMEFVANLKAVI